MTIPSEENPKQGEKAYADRLSSLRHDIYNQLSNIYLAIEQLRHEIPENLSECSFYLDLISNSSEKINELLKGKE